MCVTCCQNVGWWQRYRNSFRFTAYSAKDKPRIVDIVKVAAF